MEHHISNIVEHMAKSHEELSNTLRASRDIAMHMAYLIESIPDENVSFLREGRQMLLNESSELNGSISSYLNSIGDLQEALGDNLKLIMKQLREEAEQE